MPTEKKKSGKQPEYILRLRVKPMGDYDPDGYVRLRRALKCLGRSFGLSTVSVIPAPESSDVDQAEIDRRARYAKWTAQVREMLDRNAQTEATRARRSTPDCSGDSDQTKIPDFGT